MTETSDLNERHESALTPTIGSKGELSSDMYGNFIAQYFSEKSIDFAELILAASTTMPASTKLAIVSKLVEAEQSSSINPFLIFAKEVFPEMVKQYQGNKQVLERQTFEPVTDYEKSYTTGEAKKIIGRSINSIKEYVADFKLVGYKVGNRTKLPAWQFGEDCVVPGVDSILGRMGINGVDAESTFTLQLERFNGKCIVDALREGNIPQALDMLASIEQQ